MVGIVLSDITRFFMQASAGAAGAASLWGFIFWMKARKENGERSESFSTLSRVTFVIFLVAIGIFLATWAYSFFAFIPAAQAHEGIVIKPQRVDIARGFELNLPLVSILTLIALLGIFLWRKRDLFKKYGGMIFLPQFLLVSLILLFGVTAEEFGRNQIFFWLHGWHSIITLGTVVAVDVLYLVTLHSAALKRALYPFFPVMSAAIWIGLGLDFASVFLIIEDALHVTSQFLFNQTVVGLIIINGAFLSGKTNDFLISLIRPDRVDSISPRTNLIFGISGSLSIVSWTTITFLDFVNLPFSYVEFLFIYLAFISIAFFSHLVLEKLLATRKVVPSVV
ncbi:MAG: hypothetical protein AAB958_02285 [Patescibacteria group bacterium]